MARIILENGITHVIHFATLLSGKLWPCHDELAAARKHVFVLSQIGGGDAAKAVYPAGLL